MTIFRNHLNLSFAAALTRLAALCAGLSLALSTTDLQAAEASKSPPLRLVFIAYQNPDQLLDETGPVIDYLEGRLGRKIEHFAATDYAGVVEALRNETADAGFMGPLQYVIAHEQAGVVPILGEIYNGSPTYVSKIFVSKGSGLETLADLRGKTIAFVDPISSSGYLYPLDIFHTAGLIEKRDDAERFFRKIYFAGGDEQALRALKNGFVDAVGVGQYAFNLLRGNERNEVAVLAESRPIPSHGVFVRKGLDPATVTALKKALLALNEGPNTGLLESLYNIDGYVAASDETYDSVRRLARQYGFLD